MEELKECDVKIEEDTRIIAKIVSLSSDKTFQRNPNPVQRTTMVRFLARSMTRKAVVISAFVFLCSLMTTAAGKPNTPQKTKIDPPMEAFVGEEFTYRLQILGATSGGSFIRVGKPRSWRGKKVIPLLGGGKTTGFWRNIYRVDNQIVSLVDKSSGLPVFTEIRVDTEDKLEEYTFQVNRKGKKRKASLAGKRTTKGKPSKKLSERVHAKTHDLISWIFALRLMNLSPGDKEVVYTFSGNFPYRVSLKAGANEKVWTPSGFIIGTHITGTVQRLGGSDFKKEFSIWLTPDAAKTPIKLAFDTKIGRAQAILKAVKRRPGL